MSLRYNGYFYRLWLLGPLWYPQGLTVHVPVDSKLPLLSTYIKSERGKSHFAKINLPLGGEEGWDLFFASKQKKGTFFLPRILSFYVDSSLRLIF